MPSVKHSFLLGGGRGCHSPQWARASSFTRVLDHTQRQPLSVGLLWTSDQPVAETTTWQHTTLKETDIHAPGGIRTHNPSRRAAADLRLRPRGHRDRRHTALFTLFWTRITDKVESVNGFKFVYLTHFRTHVGYSFVTIKWALQHL